MSYQVLARKYRPQRFSEVIGQDHVTRTLQNAIEQQRIAHGYIFSGHRGIGKTTIARILAMALNCRGADGLADRPQTEPCGVCKSCQAISSSSRVDVDSLSFEETHSLNYEEIDAATNRGIDEARRIIGKITNGRPVGGERYRIIVLDEAHQLTDAAFNSLLKILEEPPSWAAFMLATTQPEDIPQTIRSRCQHFSFHAVKFDDIVHQLGDIARKENVEADDAALAILAEAGDGSMRDALSIMDQAIAGCGNKLKGEQVRGLLGSVGPEILEELMGAVARNASDEALRLLDKQIMEGHNPAHLARQLVRMLRNVLVAKVAGDDSALLQISADERARAGRIAGEFSEEDLARFLQIMLRTFDELGYRQEQRFHLELGVLKLVHAQRLLPLEQVLTQVSGATAKPGPAVMERRSSSPSHVASGGPSESQPRVSPFDADRARKARGFDPEMSAGTLSQPAGNATAVAVATGIAEAPDVQGEEAMSFAAKIMSRVLAELIKDPGNDNLVATLEGGSVELTESELIVRIDKPASVIPFIMSPDQKKAAGMAATAAAGRPLKLTLIGGAPSTANGAKAQAIVGNGLSARSRAAEDPVVRRMQEKFGAEIRTVIDHREKR
jgi:DNA polymerase-3 subunit gamma/tau